MPGERPESLAEERPVATATVYLNGVFLPRSEAKIDPEDRGFQFGDGVYEVLLVKDGLPLFAKEHFERLERSAGDIEIPLPVTREAFDQLVKDLIRTNHLVEGLVYLQLTRGVAPRAHTFPEHVTPTLYVSVKAQPDPDFADGVACIVFPDERWHRLDLKTVNLLPNVLASEAAHRKGAFEAILVRPDGTVTECSHSNVWIVKQGICLTHPADRNILHGVTRKTALQALASHGIPHREEAFSEHDLRLADEVFLTSTTAGVAPIVELDGRPVGDGRPGPVTQRARAAYRDEVGQELARARATAGF